MRGADHALAAAELEPGGRGLVSHAPRQPQCIAHAVGGRFVMPQTHSAKRRPKRGRVDGDDHVLAAASSPAHHEFLVLERDRRDGRRPTTSVRALEVADEGVATLGRPLVLSVTLIGSTPSFPVGP